MTAVMSLYQRCLIKIHFYVLWSRSWREEHQEQSCCPPWVRCPTPWRKSWGMFQRNPENIITDETRLTLRLSSQSGHDKNLIHGYQAWSGDLYLTSVSSRSSRSLTTFTSPSLFTSSSPSCLASLAVWIRPVLMRTLSIREDGEKRMAKKMIEMTERS